MVISFVKASALRMVGNQENRLVKKSNYRDSKDDNLRSGEGDAKPENLLGK